LFTNTFAALLLCACPCARSRAKSKPAVERLNHQKTVPAGHFKGTMHSSAAFYRSLDTTSWASILPTRSRHFPLKVNKSHPGHNKLSWVPHLEILWDALFKKSA